MDALVSTFRAGCKLRLRQTRVCRHHARELMQQIAFPEFSGLRCLMMPYIQGDSQSVPADYASYSDILNGTFLRRGEIGYLTIDESEAVAGSPHRGARARHARALHTEAGILRGVCKWGGGAPSWGGSPKVTLERDTRILVASNMSGTCAVWGCEHEDTSEDGDIGHLADLYPYSGATILMAGEVAEIGVLTPHESLPVNENVRRQFLRIVGSGVHGREPYFTENPCLGS